jgi:hypothetical protein
METITTFASVDRYDERIIKKDKLILIIFDITNNNNFHHQSFRSLFQQVFIRSFTFFLI